MSITKPNLILHVYDHSKHSHLLPDFADVHIACMENDATIATFTRPWDRDVITSWWRKQAEETLGERRDLFFMTGIPVGGQKEQVAGYVSLSKPFSQTGPFRGIVEKLLVSPNFRKLGVAKSLMEKLEERATQQGRTLLMLDTETGSPAEIVYSKLGYILLGKIPDYGISPSGGLKDGTFFYKLLPSHPSSHATKQ